jgi:hypothetical protein
MSIIDDDVLAMLLDPFLSVPIVFGAAKTRGILSCGDRAVIDESGADVHVSSTVLRVASAQLETGKTLQGLDVDSAVTVDGVSYRVRAIRPIAADGRVTELVLAAV